MKGSTLFSLVILFFSLQTFSFAQGTVPRVNTKFYAVNATGLGFDFTFTNIGGASLVGEVYIEFHIDVVGLEELDYTNFTIKEGYDGSFFDVLDLATNSFVLNMKS